MGVRETNKSLGTEKRLPIPFRFVKQGDARLMGAATALSAREVIVSHRSWVLSKIKGHVGQHRPLFRAGLHEDQTLNPKNK